MALLLLPILTFVLVSILGSGKSYGLEFIMIALVPPFIGFSVSPILAIISLLRYEKLPWLAIGVLAPTISSLVLLAINFVIKLFQ